MAGYISDFGMIWVWDKEIMERDIKELWNEILIARKFDELNITT